MIFSKIPEFFLNLLYPKRCRFCNSVIGFDNCKECDNAVKKIKRPIGTPLQRQSHNMDCLTFVYVPYQYTSPVSDAILRFKFSDKPLDEKSFAEDIAAEIKCADNVPYFDFITCVPSTKNEVKEHGRNLPHVLAEHLSQIMNIQFDDSVLTKVKETKRQMSLSGEQRRKNLKGAFAVTDEYKVNGKSILIIDDVFTTGTTLNECAETLRKSGAICCCAATIAVTVR